MLKIISIALLSSILFYTQTSSGLNATDSTTTGGVTRFTALTVKVSAANDSATIVVDSSMLVAAGSGSSSSSSSSGSLSTVSVNILANDINGATAILQGSGAGTYGYVVGGIDGGKLTYQVNLNHPAVQKLITTPGAPALRDFFNYTVKAASPNENQSAQATVIINIVAGYIQPLKANNFEDSIVVENAIAASKAGATTSSGTSSSSSSSSTTTQAGIVSGNLLTYNNGLNGSIDTSLRYQIVDSLLGKYGYLQFSSSTNSFSYQLNTSSSAVQKLAGSGQVLKEIFNYTVTNRNGDKGNAQIIIDIVSNSNVSFDDNVEIEINNRSNLATPLNNAQFMRGNLMNSSDRDWYYINTSGNEIIDLELCPQGTACYGQSAWVMYIFDEDKFKNTTFNNLPVEDATIALRRTRDDGSSVDPYNASSSYPKATASDHMYLLYRSRVFGNGSSADGSLLAVIDPCFGSSNSVQVNLGGIGVEPGSSKNLLIAISSPLQGDIAATPTSPCGTGNIVLKRPGPVLKETTAPATTTSTVGNTSTSTTSTTKDVPTTDEYIAILPSSDDQYTFKVTRTGISPIATKKSVDEAVYNGATGSVTLPKVRVFDKLFSVNLQQAPSGKSTNSLPSFKIVGADMLSEALSANPYLVTYNPTNNIVILPKVTDASSNQSFSVKLQYQPNNTLQLLSVSPVQ